MDATITLRQYLDKDMAFVIPDYQRGYIWGKKRAAGDDSVTYIMKTLTSKFRVSAPVFLQGVTVTESRECREIALIDGQQRTTFLYILLRRLGYAGPFSIKYMVRKESERFLEELTSDATFTAAEIADDDYQDRSFFKKTCSIINRSLADAGIEGADRAAFADFVLDQVRFLYIVIPESQARKVFTMMNGSRAQMLPQEVVKAEILRLVSQGDADTAAHEWELNLLRSRFARQWDRWLYWWNRPEVRSAFNVSTQMGWLLASVMDVNRKKFAVTFEDFFNDIAGDRPGERTKRIALEDRKSVV